MAEGFKLAEAFVDVTARDNTAAGAKRIQQQLSQMRAVMQLDADARAINTKIAAVENRLRQLRAKPTTVEVDAQAAKAEADLVRLHNRLAAISDKRVQVTVDVDGTSRVTALNNALNRMGRLDPFAHLNRRALLHVSILGLVAGAAGAAGAAIAAIPALGASLGGIGGVLVGAFSGVGDALKGLTADQEAAKTAGDRSAVSAASNARQIRDAQQSIASARRNQAQVARDSADAVAEAERDQAQVSDDVAESIAAAKRNQARVTRDTAEAVAGASRRVEDALEAEGNAHRDLADAVKERIRQMEDLREQVSDYALDQEGAAIRVIEAENQLAAINADATTTALDRRKAEHELAVARERVSDLTREQTESTAELVEAERKGVNGSDLVVDAQGRVFDAHRNVEDAQRNLATTQRDAAEAQADAARQVRDAVTEGARAQQEAARRVAKAVRDGAEAQEDAAIAVAEAMEGLADAHEQYALSSAVAANSTNNFATAMAKLTPEGRTFVEQLIRMKPLIRDLRDTSQRSFLPGLTDMLRDSEGLFPILHGHLERTGLIMADTARKAGAMFKSDEFKANLDAMFRSSEPITRAIGDGLVTLSGRLVKFGADMAPAADGFAGFIDKTILGMEGFFDKLTPHSETFRRIWEALGRIMQVLLPVLGDVIGQLAEHLAPALESVAGWMETNHDKVDDLIFVLGGLFLLFRGIGIVTGVAKWATGVIGMFDKIGGAAATNKTKVGLLKAALGIGGILAGSAAIGAIAPGGVDDEGRNPFDNTANDLGGAAGAVASGDFKSIFDDIGEEIKQLGRTWADGEAPIQHHWETYKTFIGVLPVAIRGWFGGMRDQVTGRSGEMRTAVRDSVSGMWSNISGTFSSLPGVVDGWFRNTRDNAVNRLIELKDSALQRALETWVGFSGWWSRLGGDVNSWFTNARDRVGERLRELRDDTWQKASDTWTGLSGWWSRLGEDTSSWFGDARDRVGDRLRELKDGALQRAGDTWHGLSGWWSRLGGDTNAWFTDVRDRAGDRLRELKDGALQRASDIWGGFTGWLRRTRDDASTLMWEMRDRVGGALNGLTDGFWRTVDTIGRKWNELRELVAAPIRFVVNEVWNRVNDLWGGDDIPVRFATGGQVAGRGSGDTVPAMLTPGEFVVRKDVAGPSMGFLTALNAGQPQARAAVDAVQYFAAGGPVYQGLFDAVRRQFPSASLNSGYRGGDPGYHGRGQAVDLGQVGRSGGIGHPYLAAMNRWIHDTHGRGTAELIYNGLGDDRVNIKNGRPLAYDSATQAQHRNHVHWAMESLGSLGGASGGGIGGFFAGLAEGAIRAALSPLNALISSLPTAPPLMKGVPRDIVTKVRDSLVEKALTFVGFGGAEAGGGAGVERWRGVVNQALGIVGQPASMAGITLRRMNQESGGRIDAINRNDINWWNGNPSVGLMQVIGCVPLTTEILTRRGWLTHDQVHAGDFTLGLNPATGRSEWTRINRVMQYPSGRVLRIGGKWWNAEVTPDHRWWSETKRRVPVEKNTYCAACDREFLTPRGCQTHLGKMHGAPRPRAPHHYVGEFVATSDLSSNHRIRTAAPADTDGIPCLSLTDVRVLSWLQGDGHITKAYGKPVVCPECGWVPGQGRRPHRGPVKQPANSVAVHRAHIHHASKTDTACDVDNGDYDGSIYQSKPEQVVKLRALLVDVPHSEHVRQRQAHYYPAHQFQLRRAYVTDLLKRSQLLEIGDEALVLALSPDQRAAWLDSMIDAEGNRQKCPDGKGGYWRDCVRIAQRDGTLQDAIKLAVYLEGYQPSVSRLKQYKDHHAPAGLITMTKPFVVPSMFGPTEDLGEQPVWCVETDLGTWTMRQNGIPVLTGNSTYRAHRHPAFDTGPYLYGTSTNPLSNILASMRYSLGRYGSLPSAYNRAGGYDEGGMLPPGLSVAYNGTGAPEPVFTSRQLADLTRRRGPEQVTVNVIQKSGSPAETGRFVALALRGTG